MSWATRRQVAYAAVNRQLGGVSVIAGALTGVGILDMPGEHVMDGMVISTGYTLECDAATFGALSYGDLVNVDGVVYRVQENRLMRDGSLTRMQLEQVLTIAAQLTTLLGDVLTTLDGRTLVTL